VKGTITQPKGGGDLVFNGDFFTTARPASSLTAAQKAELKRMFDEEKKQVDKAHALREKTGNVDERNSLYSLLPRTVTIDAPRSVELGMQAHLLASVKPALGDAEVVSYAWHLGDGRAVQGRDITIKYEKEGHYTLRLDVMDEFAAHGTAFRTIAVVGRSEPDEPSRKK
jgi:hypothetical protein